MQKPNISFLKKYKRKHLILIAGILIICILAAIFVPSFFKKDEKNNVRTEARVTRGTVMKTVEGSGTIEAIDQYTISALVSGEILSDTFEEGDMVEKDDLLYTIDSTNLDYTIQKAQSSVETAQLSYDETMKNISYQSVTAPISGTITELYVKEGDEISAGTKIAEIINQDTLCLTLDFLTEDARRIQTGDIASVTAVTAPSEVLSGTVKSVASGSITNPSGTPVTKVEILVHNPGALLPDTLATATVGSYACNAAGTLSYLDKKTVVAKTGGEVTALTYKSGDAIESGAQILKLYSDNTDISIKKSSISLNDAAHSLQNAYDQLADYQIKAPISGKVIQKNVKAGDKLDSGSGSNASSMAIIADLSTLTFEMSVDELDITSIREGQTVEVTADAVEGKTFSGIVDNVSIVGTTQNGVTSYPVKVVLDGAESESLIPGMNVNATIIVESHTDVLLVPLSAVERNNLVLLKGDAPSKSTDDAARPLPENAPEGYYYVSIETGISDDSFIEVTKGLQEGDILLLPDTDSNKNVEFTMAAPQGMMGNMSGMGARSGMGGGMPSGGMPGGNMR